MVYDMLYRGILKDQRSTESTTQNCIRYGLSTELARHAMDAWLLAYWLLGSIDFNLYWLHTAVSRAPGPGAFRKEGFQGTASMFCPNYGT